MLYYHNEITGSWTTNHKEAVSWYNNGYAVELNKIDPETGALEKCAEWVWQGTNPTPIYIFSSFCTIPLRRTLYVTHGHPSTAYKCSIRNILSQFPKPSCISHTNTCSPPIDTIAAFFFVQNDE